MADRKPGYMTPGFRTPGEKVHQKSSRAAQVRRRRVVLAVVLLVVAVVAVVTAFFWPGFARQEAEPLPEVTVTAAPPTPTAEASPLPEDATDFLSAMPDSALQLVRLDTAEGGWIEEVDAVEAWEIVYADGSEGGEQVDLVTGQWPDGDAAAEVYTSLLQAAGEPVAEGDVTVGGEAVGDYAVTPGSAAGESVVTWRNDTAVFQATGPDQLVQDFYETFPM
ncbi:hypothetical protein [Isoptericola sp. AK164]|uniref:hypothetical protein n=1 Tax=Isoptericola sp. AK164 TaxID=3024246 RepID=UPI0024182E1A|nr:hypothetical protein [Isoptericola sp. AK164]